MDRDLFSPMGYSPPSSYRPYYPQASGPSSSEQHATVTKEGHFTYDQAHEFLQFCRKSYSPPRRHDVSSPWEGYNMEKPLRVKMPWTDWVKLSNDLGETEERPYPSYNAATSTLIIQCMPSPLHESITSMFGREIDAVVRSLPRDTRQRIITTHNEDYNRFDGDWTGSKKIPDLALRVKNDTGQIDVKWVLEVGFAESYDQLREDVDLWIQGCPEVSMVCLVKFTEDPPFKCPISYDDDLDELGLPSKMKEVHNKDVHCSPHGNATYKGYEWVGQISEAFLETWVRGEDGTARQRGRRRSLLPPEHPRIRISLKDFLTIPAGHNAVVSLDIQDFHVLVQDSIRRLAVLRYGDMLRERAKRMGDEP